MIDLVLWGPVLCAGALAGASAGVLGTYIVGMRIPFLGVCVAHAALAGAVLGKLAGFDGPALMLPALAGATLMALVVGMIDPERFRVDSNVVLGMLFSLTMGLAFLGLGLFDLYGVSKNDVLDLLWGSVLACRWRDCAIMAASTAVQLLFLAAFYKEMRAILFSRLHASAAGVRVTLVWTLFLIVTSLVVTVNFQTVGGLMIYSLLTNPAAAAFLLVRGYGRTLVVSGMLGAGSGVGGFLICKATDLPAGAMIVILSSLLVGVAAVVGRWRRRPDVA
ncbi:MAG: metal ABC transporter permease [Pirellulales bacterium]|nr:metal ABC transporter permease [Pirellulales bacterium]